MGSEEVKSSNAHYDLNLPLKARKKEIFVAQGAKESQNWTFKNNRRNLIF